MDGSGDGDVGDEQHIRDPSGDDGGTREQHQQRPPNAKQTTLPFGQPPPPPAHRTNYKDFGLPEPRTELSIKVMDQFHVMRSVKKDVEGVRCKCRWCGNLPNVTRLTQHFTNEFAPRQRGNMETPAHRKEGSNKHIKGCERASERFKLEIRELNTRQRARAAELALLPELASSSLFEEAYRFSSQFPGYKLPSEKRLRTTLLNANYETVKEETEKKMFDHMVWDKITISCDGWTNRNGRPQMNMLHMSRHGELAHRHVDGSNETKRAVWIAEHIMKDIEKRGPHNVLQFVADNASANIFAGKLVRERYPHIIFGGCVAHGLDLIMEDIGKQRSTNMEISMFVTENFQKVSKFSPPSLRHGKKLSGPKSGTEKNPEKRVFKKNFRRVQKRRPHQNKAF
ncbi:hypothetical protein R1sor_021897 [Riccia sorocarpa]|uniref:DUF659 domain-containing protein n=1 Tax=Riccia sorocarpa TaxID=122646 RepID=A0ABD3GM46_9MARC